METIPGLKELTDQKSAAYTAWQDAVMAAELAFEAHFADCRELDRAYLAVQAAAAAFREASNALQNAREFTPLRIKELKEAGKEGSDEERKVFKNLRKVRRVVEDAEQLVAS